MFSLRQVSKSYRDLKAVDGLTLEARAGEVLGLLGPNGAGKTTTISMIVGLLRPDSGEVRLLSGAQEHNPADAETRRLVGICPQAIALYDELTGEENLRFFASLYDMQGTKLAERVQECLAFVGLSDRGGHAVGGYSGGMKRRLNLAAALIHDPMLVLMDEPTAGVDPQSRNALFEIVERLRERGKTVVYSTHYMEEAQRLCDRVAIIDRGRLLAIGTVDDLIREHGGQALVRLRHLGDRQASEVLTDDPLKELAAALARGGVQSAAIESPQLETVFLKLTGRSLRD